MFIKRLLNNDIIFLILSLLLGLLIFNFINKTGSFIFLDTSIPWSKEAWNLWLNDHIYAWNNLLGGGYPRTTYFSQGISFFIINIFVIFFTKINIAFYFYYAFIFGVGVFFGYKFINLFIENKFISYLAGLFIFINPFSIQWINLYVFYIALLGLTLALYGYIKFLRNGKIFYLILFALGTLFLFTYQRFIFSFLFIFLFFLIYENISNIKKLFSKEYFKKYLLLFISIVGINSVWVTPILLNKVDGIKTIDGYENHLLHNEIYEKENIFNGLNINSNLINFININDTTDNYAKFFQKYHGDNNLFLFFPFLVLLIFIIIFIKEKKKSYTYLLGYLLIILFLLYSFHFLSINNYFILNKIIPALNVTHFYFQLTIIPVFSLILAYNLDFFYNKSKLIIYLIFIFNFIYFLVLLKPLILNKDIYQNKDISGFEFNHCNNNHYKTYETLVYPFSLKSIGFIFNKDLLAYNIGYNNCMRLYNYSMYQISTYEGKNIRDELFYNNFNRFDLETLKKYNIGEIILLNNNLFEPYSQDLFLQEYGNIYRQLSQRGYKMVENNNNYIKFKIFDKNISWEFNGYGNIEVKPENYSKYLINISNNSYGNLIFKESYHKKWNLFKVDNKYCNFKNDKGELINNNEKYNYDFLNGYKDLINFLMGKFKKINDDRISLVDGYLTNININNLNGCYIFYFKPQFYYYIGLFFSIVTFISLLILTTLQEIRIFLSKRKIIKRLHK